MDTSAPDAPDVRQPANVAHPGAVNPEIVNFLHWLAG
jgi:hypothetical protein